MAKLSIASESELIDFLRNYLRSIGVTEAQREAHLVCLLKDVR
jgi:hypothetical protein